MEDKRGIFVNNLLNYVKKDVSLPSGYNQFVLSVTPSSSILFQGVNINDISKVQKKYGLSDSLISQIKAAQYASSSNVYSKISESLMPTFGSYKETLGSAFREGSIIYFAMITVDSIADLQARKVNVCAESCSGWWIFKSCSEKCQLEDAGYTASDKDMIMKAIQYFSVQNLIKYINELKKPGFQTYISSGHYIQSSDGNSKAFVTNFGTIGIGDSKDIQFFEPISTMKFVGSDGSVKTSVLGSAYQACISSNDCYVFSAPGHHRINYIGALTGSQSLKNVLTYREKHKGTYYLKVLNTGNLVLYNGASIVWQSNTAGKGTGPYDIEISNDKSLILKDSTGKVIYTSGTFKEWRVFEHYEHNSHNGINDDSSSVLVPWWPTESWRVPGYAESGTTPLYLCQYTAYRNLIEFITEVTPKNRFVSKSSTCNGKTKVGFIGYIYNTQLSGTLPVYDCNGGDENDLVTSLLSKCPTGTARGLLGYAFPELFVAQVN